MNNIEERKKAAGRKALEFIEKGQVVGLGTGSTTEYFIKALGETDKDIVGVPTSFMAQNLARSLGIPVINDPESIDLAVDGADEIGPNLNLIKGRGGAMVREKIIDYAANRFLVVADDSKLVERIGIKKPVPVEVMNEAWRLVIRKLGSFPEVNKVNLRMAQEKDGPVISDNGNFILDISFKSIDSPNSLESRINEIPGVLDNGLFTKECKVLVGKKSGVKIIE